MRRLVYRQTHGPICELNPSYKFEYTNQIFEDGEWKFTNRFIGKFGARPIVWYATKEWAEQCAPKDDDVDEMIEWDGKDPVGYANVFRPPQINDINNNVN